MWLSDAYARKACESISLAMVSHAMMDGPDERNVAAQLFQNIWPVSKLSSRKPKRKGEGSKIHVFLP